MATAFINIYKCTYVRTANEINVLNKSKSVFVKMSYDDRRKCVRWQII